MIKTIIYRRRKKEPIEFEKERKKERKKERERESIVASSIKW
jgi:hypothetical protein